MSKWQCRWSPTLGKLEATHQKIWGTENYRDIEKPCIFFGLYGLPDFMVLRQHKGKRAILWAGSDIRHFVSGYWIDDKGKIKIDPKPLAKWINKNCESWIENKVEYDALKKFGIKSRICPSFLGDVNKFKISFKSNNKLYSSVSGNDFKLYGWDKIDKLAGENKDIEFHLYGNTKPFKTKNKNIILHGRVSKGQMNKEIKQMAGAIRMTEFDGFSEIIAKSVLMGQYPVSLIKYPHTISPEKIRDILKKKKPNIKGREYFIKILNKFIWNTKN